MTLTVVRQDDLADRLLDREKHQEWQGERTRMVYAFPTNQPLWDRYAKLRAEGLKSGSGLRDATAFYLEHRRAMDEGSRVAWEARFNHDEASALQHAMNLRLQDEAAFHAEYQNDPLPEATALDDELLTAEAIAAKTNGMPRGELPIGTSHLTAFVDVQAKCLFWCVVAWEDDFSGTVVDYGTEPDQKFPAGTAWTLRDVKRTLAAASPRAGLEGSLYAGLERVTEHLVAREWRRDDGAMVRVSRLLVDANWGSSTDVVYQFCRETKHAGTVMPSHGRYVGASSVPFSDYKRRRGERVGLNWRIPTVSGKRAVRHVTFDTNFWKSFVHARLAVPHGDPGSLSLFGRDSRAHEVLAAHLTSEYRVKTEGRGRVVDEWKLRLAGADNHWLDCLVGCAVAASMEGSVLFGTDAKVVARPRVKLSAIRKGGR
jgi:phage terminase large subunit GpA-like protein